MALLHVNRAINVLPTSFYLRMSNVNSINRSSSEEQSIVFDGAIKAQWSNHRFVVLFKAAKLDFFACPSTDRAVLFGILNTSERRLSEALNQTDESDGEETEEEEDLHLKHLLDCWKGSLLAYMTILFLELRCGNFLPF
jgi:hypothetical protein